MPKRRSSSNSNKQREDKLEAALPDPPPPPPAALVRLLQKNSQALKYFQALQANLDQDVQKWKTRARKYQAESLEWKEKAEHLHHEQQKSIRNFSSPLPTVSKVINETQPSTKRIKVALPSAAAKAKINEEDCLDLAYSSSDGGDDNEPPIHTNCLLRAKTKAPLNILKLSSDEDDDEDDASTGSLESKFSPQEILISKASSSSQILNREYLDHAIDNLKRAQQYLDQLGISMVSERVIEEFSDNKRANVNMENLDDPLEQRPISKVVLEKRTDQSVIIDLLQVIKIMVRVRVVNEKADCRVVYYPFMSNQLLPCFLSSDNITDPKSPPHPAVEGYKLLSDALCLMDVYCPFLDLLVEYDPEGDNGKLILGMRDRHQMVRNFIESLKGEIIQLWPVQDRTTRLITASLHFYPSTKLVEEEDKTSYVSFGSKNLQRLAALCERCFLARLVTDIYFFRDDPMEAFHFFWNYLLTTSPTMMMTKNENHQDSTLLPPVQSICVLESILHSTSNFSKDNLLSVFSASYPSLSKWTFRVISLVVNSTAAIHKARSGSKDDRITDAAHVEINAYNRLITTFGFHVNQVKSAPLENISKISISIVQELLALKTDDSALLSSLPFLLELMLVLAGDIEFVDQIFTNSCSSVLNNAKTMRNSTWESNRCILLACAKARKQLGIRKLDSQRQVVSSPLTLIPGGKTLWDYSAGILNLSEHGLSQDSSVLNLSSLALSISKELADGESAFQAVKMLLPRLTKDVAHQRSFQKALDLILSVGQIPTVRFINLERRPDRKIAFITQATHQELLVMRGVARLGTSKELNGRNEFSFGGRYAFDGQGRPDQVEKRLCQILGCDFEKLSTLVATHWRPNDLKPFDSEAPDSLNQARISPSEKACALSHIASWSGVVRSLSFVPTGEFGENGKSFDKKKHH
jgi:hypothetical protein